ncbi:unnamed protein product, partial [Pleuronectes platessa]
ECTRSQTPEKVGESRARENIERRDKVNQMLSSTRQHQEELSEAAQERQQMPGFFSPCGDLNVAHSEQTLIHSGGDLSPVALSFGPVTRFLPS